MKYLFLLPFALLVPAANAMDYVKCEAMQKAMSRLQLTMESEAKSARSAIVDPALNKNLSNCIANSKALGFKTMSDCISALSKEPLAEGEAAKQAVLARYAPRLAKVQADYEKEGCY